MVPGQQRDDLKSLGGWFEVSTDDGRDSECVGPWISSRVRTTSISSRISGKIKQVSDSLSSETRISIVGRLKGSPDSLKTSFISQDFDRFKTRLVLINQWYKTRGFLYVENSNFKQR